MIRYPLCVTIDTNIFDSTGYDLSQGNTLNHLCSYVESGKIKIVLSNIVIQEMQKHIQNKAREIATLSNKLQKEIKANAHYSDDLVSSIGMAHLLKKVKREDLAKMAKRNLDDFIAKLNVEIMDNSMVDADQIFSDYFSYAAPFEDNEKKRKEFPDAFIAAQIRNRFANEASVAIVSNDNGFKAACGKSRAMMFFDSLGALYDLLSKEEETYSDAVLSVQNVLQAIGKEIENIIRDNECVTVIGTSHDKDGIIEGYDYDETYVESVSDFNVNIHSIDEIKDNQVFATLLCTAKIQVRCFFDDYNNAAWDSETKSYFFVETREMLENHNAKFAIKIEMDLETKKYDLSKFCAFLGGDTRIDRFEITDEMEYECDYEREIENMDRESAGFVALDGYEEYLEEHLVNCKMKQEIISRFNKINELYQKFEEKVVEYDELMQMLKVSHNAIGLVETLLSSEVTYSYFPVKKGEKVEKEDIEEIIQWLDGLCDEIDLFANASMLPDTIDYGDSIVIRGAEGEEITFSIDEININPSLGEEVEIFIALESDSWTEQCQGYVTLTVGYIEYDEDGGVADGLQDEVKYCYDTIVEKLDEIITELQEKLDLQYDFSHVTETTN